MNLYDAIIRSLLEGMELPAGYECTLDHDDDGAVAVCRRGERSEFVCVLVAADRVEAWVNGPPDELHRMFMHRRSVNVQLCDPDCFDMIQRFVVNACSLLERQNIPWKHGV